MADQAGKWCAFRELPPQEGTKTKSWVLVTTYGEPLALGTVKFFPRWRQYSFFPLPETIYERSCLRSIADFCEARTREWRKAKE
jgi:hypothetical protein